MKIEGACEVAGSPLVCGPMTVEVDGTCEADVTQAADGELLYLPFPERATVSISQANQSSFSHNGWQAWSVDFSVPEGTPVAAVKSGVVVDAKSDSSTGCGESTCADQANFLRIDHGDGTISQYLHLELGGVEVEVGDVVGRGQVIGRSGNTGWSTGPHLHLDLLHTDGFTHPVRFVEVEEVFGDGSPFSAIELVSQNAEQAAPSTVEPSACDPWDFAYRGVQLVSPPPCSVATIGTAYPVEARVPPGFDLAVHRFSTLQGEWFTECWPADAQGVVSGEVRFGAANFADTSYLMFSSSPGGEDCQSYPSWLTSPKMLLR